MKWLALLTEIICFIILYWLQTKQKKSFNFLTILALVMGIVLGLIFKGATEYAAVTGTIYVKTLSMMVIPLLMVSLIRSIMKMESVKELTTIGGKTFFWLLFQTILAATVGVILAVVTKVGVGSHLSASSDYTQKEIPQFTQVLTDLFSGNLFQSMAEGKVIPVVFFAIIFGIAVVKVTSDGRDVTVFKDFIEASYILVYQIVKVLVKLLPYAIVALMSDTLATSDSSVLKPLLMVVLLTFIAGFFHTFITGGVLIATVGKMNPFEYFKNIMPAQIMAFTSRSSSGTLPLYVQCLTKKVGVSETIADFVGSLGMSVGMAGCAGLWPAILAVFAIHAGGSSVGIAEAALIIFMTPLVSLGTAGVPGGGILIATALFITIGLPVEVVGVFAGIDAFVDMARTLTNVSSSMTSATLVAKSEKAIVSVPQVEQVVQEKA